MKEQGGIAWFTNEAQVRNSVSKPRQALDLEGTGVVILGALGDATK